MQVDHVFILAAGKGTRMGKIGTEIPKLLWPVFEKPLLDLQVDFAKRLFPHATISINTYNYADKIEAHIKDSEYCQEVNLVIEQELLDIGGGIHNMAANVGYEGIAAIVNGDQFLSLKPSEIERFLNKLDKNTACLLGNQVNSNQLYNALKYDDEGRLEGIVPNQSIERDKTIITYTGNSFLNLSSLRKTKGESKFFDSIANPSRDNVSVEVIQDFEYWDFGTLERYHKSHFSLLSKQSEFVEFLVESSALAPKKINGASYHCGNGINLSEEYIDELGDETILLDHTETKLEILNSKKRIIWKDLIEVLP